MPTPVRAVTPSIAPRIASPAGGFRPSVSGSIKSSPIRMISIGPEGGKARVDTSFGSPFKRMRPSNPARNSGRIFGENGPAKPRTTESKIAQTFGPKLEIGKTPRTAEPRVWFTANTASKVDAGTIFAQARARNHAQVEARKVEAAKAPEVNPTTSSRPERGSQRILRNIQNPTISIDFASFQTIAKVQEPTQEGPARTGFNPAEFRTITPPVEAPKVDPKVTTRRATRPIVQVPLAELKPAIARYKSTVRRESEAVRQVQKTVEVVRGQPTPEPVRIVEQLRARNVQPQEIAARIRLVRTVGIAEDRKLMTDDKIGKAAEPILQQVDRINQILQTAQPKARELTRSVARPAEMLSRKQRDTIVALAPLIKEGDRATQERVLQTVGVSREAIQSYLQALPETRTQIAIVPETPQQRMVQETMNFVKILKKDDDEEEEKILQAKAQSLIGSIRQTYQLDALGHSEQDMQLLVERSLSQEDTVPQELRGKFSLIMVQMVRNFRQQQELRAAPPIEEGDQAGEGLHQVDLKTQNKRVELLTKAINSAEQNQAGEINKNTILEIVKRNNKAPLWSRLAKDLKQDFDGSYGYLMDAIQKAQEWVKPEVLGKIADQAMNERPAVEGTIKQTTKIVGSKEVATVMDRRFMQLIKSILKTAFISEPYSPEELPAAA